MTTLKTIPEKYLGSNDLYIVYQLYEKSKPLQLYEWYSVSFYEFQYRNVKPFKGEKAGVLVAVHINPDKVMIVTENTPKFNTSIITGKIKFVGDVHGWFSKVEFSDVTTPECWDMSEVTGIYFMGGHGGNGTNNPKTFKQLMNMCLDLDIDVYNQLTRIQYDFFHEYLIELEKKEVLSPLEEQRLEKFEILFSIPKNSITTTESSLIRHTHAGLYKKVNDIDNLSKRLEDFCENMRVKESRHFSETIKFETGVRHELNDMEERSMSSVSILEEKLFTGFETLRESIESVREQNEKLNERLDTIGLELTKRIDVEIVISRVLFILTFLFMMSSGSKFDPVQTLMWYWNNGIEI